MADAPEPLVPADVDLRGLPWMRLDTARLLDSDLFALSTGDEFKAAVALWSKSWTQLPAGSLPTDDRILAELSRAKKWPKVRAMALRGWVECSDGRLYHPVVAEQALLAWEERVVYRAKKDADAERKRAERIEREQMFALLRAAGHAPKWNTSTRDLRDMLDEVTHLSRVTGGDQSHGQESDIRNQSPAKRGTGRDGTGIALGNSSTSAEISQSADDSGARLPPDPGAISDADAKTAVTAAIALRKVGVRIQPQDPTLLALVTERFTADELALAAAEKALRDAGWWNDPDMHPELHELLAGGATQPQMGLTTEQHTAIKSAATQVSIRYIASTLRGRRREAEHDTGNNHGSTRRKAGDGGAGGRRSAVDQVQFEIDQRQRAAGTVVAHGAG